MSQYAHVAEDGAITVLCGEFKLTQTITHDGPPNDDGTPGEPVSYEDEISYGLDFLDKRSGEELTALSIYPVAPADPIPAYHQMTGQSVELVDGRPKMMHASELIPLADYKARAVAAVRDRRWAAEVGGLTVAALGGAAFPSDERTQNRVANAIKAFDEDAAMVTVDWEVAPGVFVSFDRAQLATLGVAITRHIQACFARSKALIEAVNAPENHAGVEEVLIDLHSGWPS